MKSTKILLFLIPLLFTACNRPAVIPDEKPETHANETVEADETADNLSAPENAPTENSADTAAEFDVDAIYHEVEGGGEPVSTDEETLLERCLYNIEHERKFLAAE